MGLTSSLRITELQSHTHRHTHTAFLRGSSSLIHVVFPVPTGHLYTSPVRLAGWPDSGDPIRTLNKQRKLVIGRF